MRYARTISLLLVLALGLMSAGLGMARGQAPAVGEMVLCTGHGIVVVSVDSEGKPVKSYGLCPDAALTILAALEVPPPQASPVDEAAALLIWPRDRQPGILHLPQIPGARGPPV